MNRILVALLLTATPLLASAQSQCDNAEQRDPKSLVQAFLSQDSAGEPRSAWVKWDNREPGYRGSEYTYPIDATKLEQDSLMVVRDFSIKDVQVKGNQATAAVEWFALADVWRPKGREDDVYGRRVTEIGEPLQQSYKLRKENGCWLLIDPPKPAVKVATVLGHLEAVLSANRSQPAEQVDADMRKQNYMLEREVPMLKNLMRKYAGR